MNVFNFTSLANKNFFFLETFVIFFALVIVGAFGALVKLVIVF